MKFLDIHTHHQLQSGETSFFSCPMKDWPLIKGNLHYSLEIHPWYLTEENAEKQCTWLMKTFSQSGVIAIGECGLDKLRGASFSLQLEVFKQCATLAERASLPLIIHAVKCTQELIHFQKELRPSTPWIIHGFRGRKEVAQEYLKHGFYLSFGEYYQEEALRIVPLDRLFLETDESTLSIASIYQKAAGTLEMEVDELAHQMTNNYRRIWKK